MSIEIRPAGVEDAPFIAWAEQEAARSHLERGVWDLVFPGEDAQRLDILAKIATTERIHFGHVSRFLILEVDGQPAAGLAGYEYSEHGAEQLAQAMVEALAQLGWTQEWMQAAMSGFSGFVATGYPNPDGLWIVEWVATRPEFRGRGLIRRLLLAILEQGRQRGFAKAQIGYLLGNVQAKSAYEGVGFKWLDEHCHPDFERDFGEPGIARMQLDL